jgi:FkbM family methyltransferase
LAEVSHNIDPQFLRRDFLVGSAAGLVAARFATLVTNGWSRYPEGTTTSYAQAGEDVIVAGILDRFHLTKTTYLDVGAFLPIYSNNTCLFYQKGSRGVLVEPNIDLIPELKAKRPGDTVLNVGVGQTEQSATDYYCMSLMQWNTFAKDEAERRVAESKGQVQIERVVKIPLISINRIMAEHFPPGGPDFLSIDIESLDLAVLKSIDFTRFRPKVICTETLIAMTFRMDPETTKFLASHGYEVRGMTCANTIYMDQSSAG